MQEITGMPAVASERRRERSRSGTPDFICDLPIAICDSVAVRKHLGALLFAKRTSIVGT